MIWRLAFLAIASALVLPCLAGAQEPVVIRAGMLIDGRGGVQRDAIVVVRGGRIERVVPGTTTGLTVTHDLSRYTQLQAEIHMAKLERDSEATLRVLAPDQTGKSQEWTVVLPTGSELREAGIKLTFFAPGHGYVITGHAASDPADHRLFATTITRPDGAVWTR